MPEIQLPEGRYLSCALRVAPDGGGQTRALLMRNRILAREGGVRPDVLTLGAAPDHAELREQMLEQGMLIEAIGTRNIYEHYLEHGWGDQAPTGRRLVDLGEHRIREDARPDGTPWRIVYRVPGATYAVYDYLRPDGSAWLRIPAFGLASGSAGRGEILQVGAGGEIVGEFTAVGQWFRRWIRELAEGHERTFVFMDSRYVVPHVVPMRAKRVHLIYQMHNLHVRKPYLWNSEVTRAYARVLRRIDGMDALVSLTERQRDDIAERRGRTVNMFVVPNPVDPPAAPAHEAPRDPNLVTVVARLEPQKRLHHAIAAFERVVAAVPEARLDIYGDGSRREELQSEIDRRGLGRSVTLRGFDPRARDALWTSSAFLMTSSFEGYPLSTLESMSRGCPVVSYDIKYGPREQIAEGVDGFLVPAGDIDALAERVIELLRSPELVRRMSAAARDAARCFGPSEVLARWARVLQATVDLRGKRIRLDDVRLEVTRLRPAKGSGVRRALRVGPDDARELAGVLMVKPEVARSTLDTAELRLAAIDDESGAVTDVRLRVRRGEDALRFRGFVDAPERARLRLRLTWQNSAWETDLAGARGAEPDDDGGDDGALEPAEPARLTAGPRRS